MLHRGTKKPDQLIHAYCKLTKPVNKYISKLIIVLYADVRAYSSHVNIYCQEGTSVVLSSMTPSPQTFKN